jgi:mRNA degradation ribonuclease J1/J2
MKRKNILLHDEGQVLVFDPESSRWQKGDKLDLDDIFVEGKRVGETGYELIEERARLASYGVLFVIINLDNHYKIEGKPELIQRGFLRREESPQLFSEIEKNAHNIYYEWRNQEGGKVNEDKYPDLYKKIRRKLGRKIYRQTGKKPMIISQVVK